MREAPSNTGPFPLSQVLADELEALRGKAIPLPDNLPEPNRLKEVYRQIHELRDGQTALCISGGGIRSATFGLGVLQGLAQRGILAKFEYLSTVSGGGYIGSWLTAWATHHPQGIDGVSRELAAPQSDPLISEPEPVGWLRQHSNYLSPKLGVASADSWTLVGTYLRNLLLNWLVLIPLLLAVLAVPRLYLSSARLTVSGTTLFACLTLGLGLLLFSLTYIHLFRPSLAKYRKSWPRTLREEEADGKAGSKLEDQNWFLALSLVPMLVAGLLLTLAWAWAHNSALTAGTGGPVYDWRLFAGATAVIHFIAWFISYIWLQRFSEGLRSWCGEVVVIVMSGALGGFFAWIALTQETPYGAIYDSPRFFTCFAPVSFAGAFLLAATVFVGLASSVTKDEDREWWGRSGSWLLISILAWSGLGMIVTYGPSWFERFPLASLSSGTMAGVIASWLGFSSRTAPETGQERTKKLSLLGTLPLSVIASVAVLFVLVAGSALTGRILASFSLSSNQEPYNHISLLHSAGPAIVLAFSSAMLLASLVFSRFININKFSLHSIYRNRLIRAYLGASRTRDYGDARRPNRFTGFDPDDNFQLRDLDNPRPIRKPFHILNVALNLVHGDNLAWQQRKAQSMTLSGLYCGSFASALGYRSSKEYGKNKGVGRAITLGTALAISGAAASPNMGYHSSPAVAFLLTLFNIRLGWWLGNPGAAGARTFNRAYPRLSVIQLAREAFGLTDAENPYVYLSDGGHFENLGLYEMVVRRCRYILVSDAGCDERLEFQDLGNAIRKIRIDLGVNIDINLSSFRRDDKNRVPRHFAIGTIYYDQVDSTAENGILIYLKPSLTGNESVDVTEYASHHSAFPHEPTSDQFFDESQFESYRQLGRHIALKVFEEALTKESIPVQDTFRALYDREQGQGRPDQ